MPCCILLPNLFQKGKVTPHEDIYRACLAQLNFTSEAVFLENSFMGDFLDEAELFWRKCLAK